MEGMDYRNVAYQCATGKGWPVKRMYMHQIELGAASLQLEEEFEKKISLCEKTSIGGAR